MKRFWIKSTLFLICSALPLTAAVDEDFMMRNNNRKMLVNNKILVTINGKAISVVDVMKKMDMIFYQQFRQYADDIEARHQFYSLHWKRVLQELIDKELILADAIENKIPITNGDVRQEMEMLFGPNIIATLDQLDMSYDEAFKLIKEDILTRRMTMMRVNLKALRQVTPQVVQKHYPEFAKDHVTPAKWSYQVITIRHPEPQVAKELAGSAYALLSADISLGQLKTRLDSIGVPENASINVSAPLNLTESEISPQNLEILKTLGVNQFSKPVEEKSRKESTILSRIYYLIDKQEEASMPFAEAEKIIQNKLMDEAVEAESLVYLKRLRQHYGVSERLLKDLAEQEFRPFQLN